ncbi:MAG: hypothetical protein JXQ30_17240 [Spirochaetes bacterium]|nr:hypothetical protein [Spirochaetota bacterium]
MDVLVFTDSGMIEELFETIRRSRSVRLSRLSCASLKKRVKEAEPGAFLYVDICGFEKKQRENVLRYLKNYGKKPYGVIDREGWVEDVGALFIEGAGDYIDPRRCARLTIERVRRAAALHPPPGSNAQGRKKEALRTGYILSGSDWQKIRPGKEYTFCLMYIDLDGKDRLKRNLSDDLISEADAGFRSYVEKSVAKSGGMLWIWNDFEGVVLFGFDGKECPAVLMGIRLMLSRTIYSVENSHFNVSLSFSIALHLGNTVYRRFGETGTIVSESINTVFNLGRKFGADGGFYLTRQVLEFSPPAVKECFIAAGRFEGFEIMRMRLPVSPARTGK